MHQATARVSGFMKDLDEHERVAEARVEEYRQIPVWQQYSAGWLSFLRWPFLHHMSDACWKHFKRQGGRGARVYANTPRTSLGATAGVLTRRRVAWPQLSVAMSRERNCSIPVQSDVPATDRCHDSAGKLRSTYRRFSGRVSRSVWQAYPLRSRSGRVAGAAGWH